MAESIVVFLAERVEKLVLVALQEAALVWEVDDELHKFQTSLATIKAVILDAERRQSQEHGLRIWIKKLTYVLHDFENVLDEFQCEALRKQVAKEGNKRGKVRHFFSRSNPLVLRLKMVPKIKEIKQRLDEITREKDTFNLNQLRVDGGGGCSNQRLVRETTHSFVVVSDVIGRDSDKNIIVNHLTTCSNNDNNPFVVSIVGVGGLGKTTLAKLVYNDESVKDFFELRMWVCASEEFELKQLIQKMLKSISMQKSVVSASRQNSVFDDVDKLEIDQLQQQLRQLLKHKKFLLVLDDVWSDNQSKWNGFVELLLEGAKGSSIVVTTRDTKVASAAGSIYEHKLEGLSHDYCMSLFKKTLVYGKAVGHLRELFGIGNEIVRKCGGVPLVVKSLGSLLCSNTDPKYWKMIRDNDIWRVVQIKKDIEPIIRLSYDYLPPHLKRCFAYCSLFPPDFTFDNINLRSLWIANGLIDSSDERYELEDVADQYIKELWSRSFFGELEEYGTFFTFKMHDIVHQFALTVAESDYLIVDFNMRSIPESVRHISLSSGDNNDGEESDTTSASVLLPEFLRRPSNNLQTLLFQSSEARAVPKSFVKSCIDGCNYLRVLDLRGSTFGTLPRSIYILKQLRYLDMSGNCELRRLPESLCLLQSLQYLGLAGCEVLEELPKDMWKLISLRFLSVTTKQKSLRESGVEYLKSLRSLWISGCNNLESVFEGFDMEFLKDLRTLGIDSCSSMCSLPFSSLEHLTSLESLMIANCEKLNLTEGNVVLPLSLRSVEILQIPEMVALPEWLLGSANTLQYIGIEDCPNLFGLPEWFDHLSCLERLHVSGCTNMWFMPEGLKSLIALKRLKIENCGKLGERISPDGMFWHKVAHIPEIHIDGKKITTR